MADQLIHWILYISLALIAVEILYAIYHKQATASLSRVRYRYGILIVIVLALILLAVNQIVGNMTQAILWVGGFGIAFSVIEIVSSILSKKGLKPTSFQKFLRIASVGMILMMPLLLASETIKANTTTSEDSRTSSSSESSQKSTSKKSSSQSGSKPQTNGSNNNQAVAGIDGGDSNTTMAGSQTGGTTNSDAGQVMTDGDLDSDTDTDIGATGSTASSNYAGGPAALWSSRNAAGIDQSPDESLPLTGRSIKK